VAEEEIGLVVDCRVFPHGRRVIAGRTAEVHDREAEIYAVATPLAVTACILGSYDLSASAFR
jgi:hypothetical protein